MSNVVSLDDYRPSTNDEESVILESHFHNVLKKKKVGGVTPNAVSQLLESHETTAQSYVQHLFKRFDSGDWGNVCEEDYENNQRSVSDGSMVMGVYPLHPKYPNGTKIWLIMDHGHETATVLMPEDY